MTTRLLRVLPHDTRGKGRLARALFRGQLRLRDVRIRDDQQLQYVLPSLAEPVAFHILCDGAYEIPTLSFVLTHLKAGSTFVDVGANIGALSLPASKVVGDAGRVLAIEASPRVFQYLQQNISENGISNVLAKNCAAAAGPGDLAFYDAPIEKFGMGSLAPQFDCQSIRVASATLLDSLLAEARIERADVIKVDVEGAESQVFQGARRTLTATHAPIVVFEFCDWAEQRMPGVNRGDSQIVLQEFGYTIWRSGEYGARPAFARTVDQRV